MLSLITTTVWKEPVSIMVTGARSVAEEEVEAPSEDEGRAPAEALDEEV